MSLLESTQKWNVNKACKSIKGQKLPIIIYYTLKKLFDVTQLIMEDGNSFMTSVFCTFMK